MAAQDDTPDPRHPVHAPADPGPAVEADPPARYAEITAREIGAGKPLAFLCYLLNFFLIPFWIIPLVLRNNQFALFHAKQSLMLWIYAIIGFLVSGGLIFAFGIGLFLLPIWFVAVGVENVFGMVNASCGRFHPLPIVGPDAERTFAGIRKAHAASPASPS